MNVRSFEIVFCIWFFLTGNPSNANQGVRFFNKNIISELDQNFDDRTILPNKFTSYRKYVYANRWRLSNFVSWRRRPCHLALKMYWLIVDSWLSDYANLEIRCRTASSRWTIFVYHLVWHIDERGWTPGLFHLFHFWWTRYHVLLDSMWNFAWFFLSNPILFHFVYMGIVRRAVEAAAFLARKPIMKVVRKPWTIFLEVLSRSTLRMGTGLTTH